MKKAVMILAVAALSLIGSAVYADTVVLPAEPEVGAVVTIDAGTVYEVTLDTENQVMDVVTVDETGTPTLEETDLTGQPIEEAIGQLVGEAADEGTLPADGSVIIDVIVVPVEGTDPAAAETVLEEIISEEIVEVTEELEVPVVITYQNAALERVALANTLGITPGKLNLIQKYAASTGTPETVVLTDWTGVSVKEIMAAIKTNRKAAAQPETTPEDPAVTEPVSPVVEAAAVAPLEKTAPAKSGSSEKGGSKGGSKGGKK